MLFWTVVGQDACFWDVDDLRNRFDCAGFGEYGDGVGEREQELFECRERIRRRYGLPVAVQRGDHGGDAAVYPGQPSGRELVAVFETPIQLSDGHRDDSGSDGRDSRGAGSYSGFRQTRLEIARQYRENPMLNGAPAFDVIFGGGADPFTAEGRPDKRNLIGELQALGYRYVKTATELKGLHHGQPTIGLFKGSAMPAPGSNGITTAADVNMDVAYDKLKMERPASEPVANLGTFTDQPMLELMTEKAIEILSSSFSQSPFILMVEATSIDKQSHPNQAAGTIWDTIEMDKAGGVARAWAAKRTAKGTLVVVTADHDQSMHIIL